MTEQDILDIGGLIHERWIRALDENKAVKAEKDNGDKDWAAFYATRLEYHQASEEHWSEVKQHFMEENRAVYEKLLGGI